MGRDTRRLRAQEIKARNLKPMVKRTFSDLVFRRYDSFLYPLAGVQIVAFIVVRIGFMCYNHRSGLHGVRDLLAATAQGF